VTVESGSPPERVKEGITRLSGADTFDSGSLLSRFIRGMVSVGLGDLSTMVLGLLGTIVAARHLPEEEFGAFVLLQVVAAFLVQVSSLGLDLALATSIAGEEEERHRRVLTNTAVLLRLLTVLVVSIVALVAGSALRALFGSFLSRELIVFVPVLLLLEGLTNLLQSVLQGLFLFKRRGIAGFIAAFSNLFLIVVLVLFLRLGITGLLYARLVSQALACVFVYFSIPTGKRVEFDVDIAKRLLAFGFPLQINDILSFVFQRIDTLVIGALLGPSAIAYYEIARKIPDSVARLYEAFRSVYFPFMSRLFALGDRKKAAEMLNHSTRLVAFMGSLGALLGLVFGDDIVSLLFSERYLPAVPAFVLLMVTLAISLVGNVLGTSVVAAGDTSKPAIVNTVHTAVSLMSNLILIPALGITGASLAGLAGTSAANPLNVLFLRRRVKVRVGNYLKPMGLLGLCLLVVMLVRPTTLRKLALIPLFLVSCILLSVVTREDVEALLNEIRRMPRRILRDPRSRRDRA